ncbi:MAG: hypothetical protein LBB68_00465, partial [Treponema sp.]|nr:hypothetical protein [Treponema sp.]
MKKNVSITAALLLAALVLASCGNPVLKSWYDEDPPASEAAPVLPGDCDILVYYFKSPVAVGVITGPEIAVTYPYGAAIPADTDIIIVHTGESIVPAGGWVESGGGYERTYTVTAPDGAAKRYRVRAVQAAPVLPGDCDILVYYFKSPVAVGVITGLEIAITYPFGTKFPTDIADEDDIEIVHTGELTDKGSWTRNRSSGYERTYTVTAENGATKQYHVTAKEAAG